MKRIIKKIVNVFGVDIARLNSRPAQPAPVKKAEAPRFHPYFIDKEAEGVKFRFFIGDTDGKSWYHTDATDPDWAEMKFMKEHVVKKGDVVIECGTHHGCTTILLADYTGKNGRVISYEPNPANFEIAKINIGINNISNVELINKAVGATSGAVRIDTSSSNSHVMTDDKERSAHVFTVQSMPLDSLEGIEPDVLKIDVEGFEKEVLLGASEVLKKRPKLAIEIHTEQIAKYNTSVDELFDLIGRDKYHFWIQWDDSEAPLPYNFERKIDKRVHLFALPK